LQKEQAIGIAKKFLGLDNSKHLSTAPLFALNDDGGLQNLVHQISEDKIDRNLFDSLVKDVDIILRTKFYEFCQEMKENVSQYSDILECYEV